jgi:2-oxoglutarate dehydrogenase E1 component
MSAPQEERLSSLNLPFVEALLARWRRDPASVDAGWRALFEGLDGDGDGDGASGPRAPEPVPAPGKATARTGKQSARPAAQVAPVAGVDAGALAGTVLQERVDRLVRAWRVRGHIAAQVDPLGVLRPEPEELDPSYWHIAERDMDRPVSSEALSGLQGASVRDVVEHLRATYGRAIGVQFMHIDDLARRTWLQERMEGTQNRLTLGVDTQRRILQRLIEAVTFEDYVQRKYVGAKRFSLEGAESLIPLLDLALEQAGAHGVREVVLGMAHRGRLNVLANVVGKRAARIFREFEDEADPSLRGAGDVKYHLGWSGRRRTTAGHELHVSLCFNPSHLEFVSPVALGRLRAKQDRWRLANPRAGDVPRGEHSLALLIHGDAAFIGEGVVQETLNLSELDAYRTGGALHVVVNNQLGFTTPPEEYRSTPYCTDIAKMLQIPIVHVNGEDPEAVAQALLLAMEFRRAFRSDVVIDMWCYRLRGHNEGDEPAFTQPLMYKAIRARRPVAQAYLERLLEHGGVTQAEADAMTRACEAELDSERELARSGEPIGADRAEGGPLPSDDEPWAPYRGGRDDGVEDTPTGVDTARLARLLTALARVPPGLHPHPTIERGLAQRRAMAAGKAPLDWSAAEALALASLAEEGWPVRLTGQDTARGTFSQRHAVLHDVEDGHTHVPLQHVGRGQAPVLIANSPLSEVGVMGFEYGYSLDFPDALVAWEAQFGDFANAAQVVIDQYLASAEDKWRRLSGLTLLLPHGFEGRGPEHSSARLERFLMLAAEDNLQIVQPSTPAQYFHVLRRLVLRPWRKPLVVLTPKSLLRQSACVSSLADCATERFLRVLPDAEVAAADVTRVLLCSGRVTYDLLERRAAEARRDVAIVRLEQCYPLPEEALRAALHEVRDGTPVIWVQDEPENMGAWRWLHGRLGGRLFGRLPLRRASRPESASPATGSLATHRQEQDELLDEAFGSA